MNKQIQTKQKRRKNKEYIKRKGNREGKITNINIKHKRSYRKGCRKEEKNKTRKLEIYLLIYIQIIFIIYISKVCFFLINKY